MKAFFHLYTISSDSLEEICWSGNEALQLYNTLCKISGVWDCTAQEAEACSVADDISPTLVRLEESDYSSLGVFLPDHLVQKMEGIEVSPQLPSLLYNMLAIFIHIIKI